MADDETLPVGPVPSDLPPVTGPQLFQMQFGTVEEHVQLVERAKALLARERPRITLGELHLEAMKLLVAALERRKFAVTDRPRTGARSQRRKVERATESPSAVLRENFEPSRRPVPPPRCTDSEIEESPIPRQRVPASAAQEATAGIPRQRVPASELEQPPRQRVATPDVDRPSNGAPRQRVAEIEQASCGPPRQGVAAPEVERPSNGAPRPGSAASELERPSNGAPRRRVAALEVERAPDSSPRPRNRYVSAAVRREVYRRDAACCTYVDVHGRRCCETHYLELHHLLPFAKGGSHAASNLTLRCAAHNALAAEADFGRQRIVGRQNGTRHEALQEHEQKRRFE